MLKILPTPKLLNGSIISEWPVFAAWFTFINVQVGLGRMVWIVTHVVSLVCTVVCILLCPPPKYIKVWLSAVIKTNWSKCIYLFCWLDICLYSKHSRDCSCCESHGLWSWRHQCVPPVSLRDLRLSLLVHCSAKQPAGRLLLTCVL